MHTLNVVFDGHVDTLFYFFMFIHDFFIRIDFGIEQKYYSPQWSTLGNKELFGRPKIVP